MTTLETVRPPLTGAGIVAGLNGGRVFPFRSRLRLLGPNTAACWPAGSVPVQDYNILEREGGVSQMVDVFDVPGVGLVANCGPYSGGCEAYQRERTCCHCEAALIASGEGLVVGGDTPKPGEYRFTLEPTPDYFKQEACEICAELVPAGERYGQKAERFFGVGRGKGKWYRERCFSGHESCLIVHRTSARYGGTI